MYSIILFDLDGTLTDPREGITKSVQYALAKMGIDEPNLDCLLHFIGPPLHSEFSASYNMTSEESDRAVAFYRERFSVIGWRENLLFEGVSELLHELQNAGKRLAIASSKPTVFVEKILRLFEIDRYFETVSGATLDGTVGTKEQVVRQALSLLHANPQDCVLIGDRFHDIEGAHAAGIDCIGVSFGFGGREELTQFGADGIVDSWEELKKFLLVP